MLTQLNACWNPIDDNHVFFKSYIPNPPHGSMWIMNILLLNIIITPYWATCVNCKANSKSSTIGYTWPNFSRSVVKIWSHFQFRVFAVMCKHLQISKTYSGFMIPPHSFGILSKSFQHWRGQIFIISQSFSLVWTNGGHGTWIWHFQR